MCFHLLGNACISTLLADDKWEFSKMNKWLHYKEVESEEE
jgi:hypothetical protein